MESIRLVYNLQITPCIFTYQLLQVLSKALGELDVLKKTIQVPDVSKIFFSPKQGYFLRIGLVMYTLFVSVGCLVWLRIAVHTLILTAM